eukprot:6186817-Pleurochrysis_carterae.AAC.1
MAQPNRQRSRHVPDRQAGIELQGKTRVFLAKKRRQVDWRRRGARSIGEEEETGRLEKRGESWRGGKRTQWRLGPSAEHSKGCSKCSLCLSGHLAQLSKHSSRPPRAAAAACESKRFVACRQCSGD